jgi:hypothetical protein
MTDPIRPPDEADWDDDDDSVWADPTMQASDEFSQAYGFFNARLFADRLPHALITMQRRGKSYGYFAGERFGIRDGEEITTDEIALNPAHFKERTVEDSLSTLVHEMCHLEQHHFGKPSRNGYHNRRWAETMKSVGLIPSNTGKTGGKQTGQQMDHYIQPGGPFDLACRALLDDGFTLSFVDLWKTPERWKKAASKTKYTCPGCGLNAWGKPEIHLVCGECKERMAADDGAQKEVDNFAAAA